MKKEYWELFKQTGEIKYYLQYIKAKTEEQYCESRRNSSKCC